MLLTMLLLPTLGRPTKAILVYSFSSSLVFGADSFFLSPSSTDSSTDSISSKMPDAEMAETGCGCPKPSFQKSVDSASPIAVLSHLFTVKMISFSEWLYRSQRAISVSEYVTPSWPSTTKTSATASSRACPTCLVILDRRTSGFMSPLKSDSEKRPPVSTRTKSSRSDVTSAYKRSRVTPGMSATSAACLPDSLLKRADFPTLGRPTMTTVGSLGRFFSLASSPSSKRPSPSSASSSSSPSLPSGPLPFPLFFCEPDVDAQERF
mmetsp:Transcript_39073/g.83694  ORF Transcript_39073/g.83694 Transcript_39073/m.83694 type:complete len:264 (-) Transcript_39073:262-1053(-)